MYLPTHLYAVCVYIMRFINQLQITMLLNAIKIKRNKYCTRVYTDVNSTSQNPNSFMPIVNIRKVIRSFINIVIKISIIILSRIANLNENPITSNAQFNYPYVIPSNGYWPYYLYTYYIYD